MKLIGVPLAHFELLERPEVSLPPSHSNAQLGSNLPNDAQLREQRLTFAVEDPLGPMDYFRKGPDCSRPRSASRVLLGILGSLGHHGATSWAFDCSHFTPS
jgi:hypothetical protein